MKHLTFIAAIFLLLGGGCKKNSKSSNPLDQLPPETQTGANTFGCLVDGEVFLPKGNPLAGPVIKAQYQFVNGKQGFGVSASKSEPGDSRSVGIIGDSVIMSTGIYGLGVLKAGNLTGGYSTIRPTLVFNDYFTSNVHRGQLTITKFDTQNQIVSGRFWYDAIDTASGKIVQVREGRFDLPYVR